MVVSTQLVIDCSALSFVDLTGAKVLGILHADLLNSGVNLNLAGCSDPVMEQLDRYLYFEKFPRTQVYPTVMDAVLSIQHSESSATNESREASPVDP